MFPAVGTSVSLRSAISTPLVCEVVNIPADAVCELLWKAVVFQGRAV